MLNSRRMKTRHVFVLCLGISIATFADDATQRPWMNPALDPDKRAELVVAQLTPEEKQTLVFAFFATDAPWKNFQAAAEARAGSAGYVPGIARLGIPPQWETDAGMGVATQGGAMEKRERTALPSGLAVSATWDPVVAREGGKMIGAEARASGFNVILAGGVNLVREPRNGRNFEYAGEDPLLAGVIVGAEISGIESNHIISTVKHYALNDQETERNTLNVVIDRAQARMSDLLAFQIAIEQSNAGSVMCSYNKVWGDHSCESAYLLNDVLRRDWGWPGYVMSDWGATHSTVKAAMAGLDQESGYPFDDQPYFAAPLLKAVQSGELSEARLTEMARRIVRTLFAKGVVDDPVVIGPIDFAAHAEVTRAGAEQGAVLLKNKHALLPLTAGGRIAVIGGYADKGVLAGSGSSLVYPVGGNAVPGLKPTSWPGPVMYYPSSPLSAIRDLAPGAAVQFASGDDQKAAARLAADSDVAIVFATQWTAESLDNPLTLPDDQDALIAAVASANPHTVVVLETGGAVFMPWLDRVGGVLETWYPGTRGGEAIAKLLFGRVNPSGRLPISFPRDESQLSRPALLETENGKKSLEVHYAEGATVGYKWFDAKKWQPLFPFGYGLTYSSFKYGNLQARVDGQDLVVKFDVRNTGKRAGKDVPQVYVSPAAAVWEAPKRLAGWRKVALDPGSSTAVELRIDPRLLAVFDESKGWQIAAGTYKVMLGSSAADLPLEVSVPLAARTLPASFKPNK
jgi:beta-glucosidase